MDLNPILFDTNAYQACKNADPAAIQIVRQASRIILSSVTLGELFAGFASGTRAEQNHRELETFLAEFLVAVVPVAGNTARHYAAIHRQLRVAGRPIPTNDMWIAASALEHDCHVFTHDNHFRQIPGLRVGATLAELL